MRLALLAVLAAGCNAAFGLDELPPPDAGTLCAYDQLGTSGDADRDGVVDALDACPTIANADAHDEDADGVPDVCDRCPHIAELSADRDCDGIGALCDPDDAIVDEQQFVGLADATGLLTHNSIVENDRVRLLTTGTMYSEAIVDTRAPSPATYELSGVVYNPQATLETTSLIVRDADAVVATSPYFEATLQFMGGTAMFLIEKADTTIASTPVGPLAAEMSYRISILLTRDTITAKLSGFADATLVAPASFYPAVEYGADAYRQDPQGTLSIEVQYLRRVVPAP